MSTSTDPIEPPEPVVPPVRTGSTSLGRPSLLALGRHPVHIGHLVMGIALAGLVVVWALVAGDVVADDDVRWLLPVPWVVAGAAGLVGLVTADRRRVGSRQVGWVESPPAGPGGGPSTMER